MDSIDPNRRSANMRRIRSKDMKPELIVRKMVHALGFRYRLHVEDLPGKPDIVLPRHRKAIFVHGCFWHYHADRSCRIARFPRSRQSYWIPKISRNKERDRRNRKALAAVGWQVLVVWECETAELNSLRKKLLAFLESPAST